MSCHLDDVIVFHVPTSYHSYSKLIEKHVKNVSSTRLTQTTLKYFPTLLDIRYNDVYIFKDLHVNKFKNAL